MEDQANALTVIVSHLPDNISPEQIVNVFSVFPGGVRDVLKTQKNTALVQFNTPEGKQQALKTENFIVFGSEVDIQPAMTNLYAVRAKMMEQQKNLEEESVRPYQYITYTVPKEETYLLNFTDIKPVMIPRSQPGNLIGDQELKTLIESINKAIMSTEKENLVAEAMSKYSITCKQAKEILDQFTISFEKKLLLSEHILKKLTDPQNLDVLLETFDFDQDRKLVKRAIRVV